MPPEPAKTAVARYIMQKDADALQLPYAVTGLVHTQPPSQRQRAIGLRYRAPCQHSFLALTSGTCPAEETGNKCYEKHANQQATLALEPLTTSFACRCAEHNILVACEPAPRLPFRSSYKNIISIPAFFHMCLHHMPCPHDSLHTRIYIT